MRKQTLLLLFLFLPPVIIPAQHPDSNTAKDKGVIPIPSPVNQSSAPVTRAVVIGISDYQDSAIPDLRYADRDAEAFAEWLHSSRGGGSQPNVSVNLLLNNEATTGKIIAALDGLISASKPGDEAIIYFSGHGDVERVTKFQRGYWLTWDSPPAVYAAGAFSLAFLQDVITTLSDFGVQVLVVSDACRSGKLAGSEFGGAQATTAALSRQFANEIKILSCQPEEFSLEGEQWGGGRGAFSYHLIDALYGMADANADGTVNLLEVERYLEDHVPAETAPHSQIPFTVGSKAAKIATVDANALSIWQKMKTAGKPDLKKIDSKAAEKLMLAEADTSILTLYAAFAAALESGNLMPNDSTVGRSAHDYYERLIREPSISGLHGLMTRIFAAALMDEGQQVVNKLLKTDDYTIQRIFAGDVDYQGIADKTAKAASLLGAKHYAYNSLKTKENYFRGAWAHRKRDDQSAKKFAFDALSYDNEAAYVYLFLSIFQEADSLKMMTDKVNELLPNWLFGQAACAVTLFMKGEYRWSLNHSLKAVALDSGFLIPYWRTAENYRALHQPDSARIWDIALGEKIVGKVKNKNIDVYSIECILGGVSLCFLNRFRDAELVFKKGWEVSLSFPPYISNFQRQLASNYVNQGKFREAMALFDSISPQDILTQFCKWETLRFYANDIQGSREWLTILVSNPDLPANWLWYLVFPLIQDKQYALADSLLQRQLRRSPNNARLLFLCAETKRCADDPEGAAHYYDQVLKTVKPEFFPGVNRVPEYCLFLLSLNRLQRTSECGALMKTISAVLAKDAWAQFWLACYFSQTGDPKMALNYLQSAENAGWHPNLAPTLEGTVFDPLLDPLRHLPEFQAWEKRWSPPYRDYSAD